MADEHTNENNESSLILATITDTETGKEETITTEQFLNTYSRSKNAIDELIDECYSIVSGFGGGLVGIDLHPEKLDTLNDGGVPINCGGSYDNAALLPGRYYGLYDAKVSDSFEENPFTGLLNEQVAPLPLISTGKGKYDGLLLLSDPALIAGSGFTLIPVTVSAKDENGNDYPDPPYEPIEGWIIKNDSENSFVSIRDMNAGIFIAASLQVELTKSGWLQKLIQDSSKNPLIVKNGKFFTESMRGKRKKNDIWPVGGAFVAEIGSIQMTSKDEKALDTAIGSSKTMVYLNAAATATDYKYEPDKVCRVRASMTDLLEKRKLKDTKKNRANLRREVNALALTSWTVRNPETGEFETIPLAGGKCSARGDAINFTFSPEFMGAILSRDAGRMATNPALLGTDEVRNPHAFTIGWKLATHSYQNIGKANETTLSVSKLLEYAEDIPAYDTVKKTDRAYTRRIIEPMERDLNHLVEIGFLEYWDYCHKKGEPLTDEEQDQRLDQEGNDCALPYETAIKLNIQWQLSEDYPEQREATVKVREQHRMDALTAKQRNAERQARIEKKKETYIAKAVAKKEMGE